MRYLNKKSKNNRSIVGIMGVLLLILGTGSLIFQYSGPVNVYAQVSVGPFFSIGPPNRSDGQDSVSDGKDIFTVYKDKDSNKVYIAKVVPNGQGERGQGQQDPPHLIIDGGTDPATAVTPGGQVKVAAKQQGEIAFVGCSDDDDNCRPSKIISNPTTGPPGEIEGEGSSTVDSCRDKSDNDGDGKIDLADVDCKWASEQESTVHGLCSDGQDNDNDGKTDSDDQDCFHPNESSGGGGTAGTTGAVGTREAAPAENNGKAAPAENNGKAAPAENNGKAAPAEANDTSGVEDNDTSGVEPTSFNLQPGTTNSSPQLTFVSTSGGDNPPASNPDIAVSSNDGSHVYAVWEQDGEIMLAASQNGGDTWGAIVNISNTPGASTEPRVATSADGKIVHVTWQDTPGNGDIFYARSTDFGKTFVEPQINLSSTPGASNDHQLVTEGSNVYVVWVDKTTNSGGEIYFKKSNSNGAPGSFGNTINLSGSTGQSFQTSQDPDMAAHGNHVAVTWAGLPDRNRGQGEIALRESHNSGGTFDKQINVSQTSRTDSKEPQVDYIPGSADEIYVAFLDAGGPTRVNTPTGTPTGTGAIYNVLATEREDGGRPFSPLVNLSDVPNPPNPDPSKSNSQLELVFDVAIWDPSGRRG